MTKSKVKNQAARAALNRKNARKRLQQEHAAWLAYKESIDTEKATIKDARDQKEYYNRKLRQAVENVISGFLYGQKGSDRSTGHFWVQRQQFTVGMLTGTVLIDAFTCTNRTFRRLTQSQIEAAIKKGVARFIVVADPSDFHKKEPLVTDWVSCMADVEKLEAYLHDWFDLFAVLAVDDNLGWQEDLAYYSAYSDVKTLGLNPLDLKPFPQFAALLFGAQVLPGCRVHEWGKYVCAQREDIRLFAIRCGNLARAQRLAEDGICPGEIGWNWEEVTGPTINELKIHERMPIKLAFVKAIDRFLMQTENIRWGKYPEHLIRDFQSYIVGCGVDDYADQILEWLKTCSQKGSQSAALPDGTRELVTVY